MISQLKPEDFSKCANIWNIEKHHKLASQFLEELTNGIRITFIYGDYLGEGSLVFDTGDPVYTIAGHRIYFSRLVVKKENRRQGIGNTLIAHMLTHAATLGYKEASIGVDTDNIPAINIYVKNGFNEILYFGEDEGGWYYKLLKTF